MRGLAMVLVCLGVADLVWINAELGPRVFADAAGDEHQAVAPVQETGRPAVPERGPESELELELELELEEEPQPEPQPEPDLESGEALGRRPESEPGEGPKPQPEIAAVSFATSRSSLDETSSAAISSIVKALKSDPELTVRLTGHADVRGRNTINYRLGLRRARAVKRDLVRSGVAASRIIVASEGEAKPRALGDDEVAHRTNRRVEIAMLAKEPK